MSSYFSKTFCCLILSFLLLGCSSLSQKINGEKKKAELELKQKNYQSLLEQINKKSLPKNLSTEEIRDTYGRPDNVYRVGSANGSLEIWTYGKGDESTPAEDWHPIRLYFDNDKLIDWNF